MRLTEGVAVLACRQEERLSRDGVGGSHPPGNVGPDYPGLVDVQQIDPRDTDTEITSPTYRVTFWERRTTQATETPAFSADEYEIADAQDVHELLRWADANAGDRTYTAYVVVNKTLVRLSGQDPTAAK